MDDDTRGELIRLESRIDGLQAEMRIGFAELRGELRAELHSGMREQTNRIIAWTIPTWISAVALSIAAARFG